MHFDDLSNNSYVGECPFLKSVGWLGAGYEFTTGEPPRDLVALLKEHLDDHWVISAAAGKHDCEFCEMPHQKHSDSRNFFIPKRGAVYFVPGMILHYIEQHNYLPPQEFIEAVRECPPQGSAEFMALMTDFGGWWEEKWKSEIQSD